METAGRRRVELKYKKKERKKSGVYGSEKSARLRRLLVHNKKGGSKRLGSI